MKSQLGILVALIGLASGVLDARLIAQPAETEGDKVVDAMSEVEEFWPASDILKMAVGNLSKRYNLNEEQRAYTDDMMSNGVSAFLESHREEVWPLLRDLVLQQRKGEAPDAETAKRLGPVALKIIREAEEEIYKSNAEWREILTDEQKRLHDWDLAEMRSTFRTMTENFEAWEQGNPTNGNLFPRRVKSKTEPRRPAEPRKAGTYHPPPADDPELDDKFELYVRKFIKDYMLKADQIDAAQSILREIKERAAAFRLANAEKIQEVKAGLNQGKVSDRRRWNATRRKLMKPITDLYVELTERLEQIPDDGQRDRFRLKAEQSTKANSAISSSKGKRATGQAKNRAPAERPADPSSEDESQ